MRLAKQTDHGLALLAELARSEAAPTSARDLAQRSRLPEPAVRKILQDLARAKILVSHRGARGGYALARPADAISVACVIEALEGPLGLVRCSPEASGLCAYETTCSVVGPLQWLSSVVHRTLAAIPLSELARHAPSASPTLS